MGSPKHQRSSSSSASQNKLVVYRFLTICRCGAVRECTSSWAPGRERAVERLDFDRSDLQKSGPLYCNSLFGVFYHFFLVYPPRIRGLEKNDRKPQKASYSREGMKWNPR
jgi:hypothetical protein